MSPDHAAVRIIRDFASETQPAWIVKAYGRICGGRFYRFSDACAHADEVRAWPAETVADWQRSTEGLRTRKLAVSA